MLYPACERERAVGLRGGRACVATGSVGRPELRGLYFAVILYVAAILYAVAICGL